MEWWQLGHGKNSQGSLNSSLGTPNNSRTDFLSGAWFLTPASGLLY